MPSLELHHPSFSGVQCPKACTVSQTDFFLLPATFLCKSSISSSGVLNSLPLLFRACSTSLISSLESGGDENFVFDNSLYFLLASYQSCADLLHICASTMQYGRWPSAASTRDPFEVQTSLTPLSPARSSSPVYSKAEYLRAVA